MAGGASGLNGIFRRLDREMGAARVEPFGCPGGMEELLPWVGILPYKPQPCPVPCSGNLTPSW